MASTVWPSPLNAQKAMPVIGYLGNGAPGPSAGGVAAFRQGLSETGYVEGQNVTIEYLWAEGFRDRLPALAADLVGRKVDVIVATGDPAAQRRKTEPRRSQSSSSQMVRFGTPMLTASRSAHATIAIRLTSGRSP